MSVLYNGLVEHPNSHFEGTLPTNGFMENPVKLLASSVSAAYSPTTATNSCGRTMATINLSSKHISGISNFVGQYYRVVFDLTWSGYTSGKAWYQGQVNYDWNHGPNWFVNSANSHKQISALCAGASSGTYHYDFHLMIPSASYDQYAFAFQIRSDSANAGTYYKISDYAIYTYNGCIDSTKMSFNHFYEW